MYLLDTDTVIYALKGHPAVTARLAELADRPMHLSVSSLMELYYGADKSSQRTRNMARIRTIAQEFNVLTFDEVIAATFGEIKAGLEGRGTPLDDMDVMIAAVALAKNLILVTNNTRHFKRISGLVLQNWCDK
jgi:predicted nucleic acid-binding protein